VLILLTAVLLPWLGLVQGLPHSHSDGSIPQEELACSVSGPNSNESHLHAAGNPLPAHPCLACLAGTSHAAAPSLVQLKREQSATRLPTAPPREAHARNRFHLPLLRGPPVVA